MILAKIFTNRNQLSVFLILFVAFHPGQTFANKGKVEVETLTNLSYGNLKLSQLRKEIAENLKASKSGKMLPHPLRVVSYRLSDKDNFFMVMAKTSQTADTLASLNGVVNPNSVSKGDTLLVPNARGVFVQGEIKKLALQFNVAEKQIYKSGDHYFVPGGYFSVNRMNFFTGKGFFDPIPAGKISSKFGMRKDPFSSRATFHGGIDISAPHGASVCASQEGKVVFSGWKNGYGKLIILRHKYGYETYYGHLSKMSVKKGDNVKAGANIGLVGMTGRSTGPHLHFELRKKGVRSRPRFVMGS